MLVLSFLAEIFPERQLVETCCCS